jgi:hypothetical protein
VTTPALAAFLRSVNESGAAVADDDLRYEVKYGPQVDADDRGIESVEWDESGALGTVGEYPWDRSASFPTLGAMADSLDADSRPVYRAWLALGSLHPEAAAALTREPSEDNEVGLYLSTLSFTVGPVRVRGLGSEAEALVGWMGLTVGGPGYFFPWEYREARKRAEGVGLVNALAEVCRRTWPVRPVPASAEVIAARRELSELWLYDDVRLPQGWWWFADESG